MWPRARRPANSAGRQGKLHAKFAIADRSLLFLSSANLTDDAFLLNMELGILVHDTALATRASDQIDALIRTGDLRLA